jgi:hypothetical protein
MNRFIISALGLSVICGTALGIEPGPSSPSQKQTETWLNLQASGHAASLIPQAAALIERDLSMQRWLDSYQHQIPEFFEQKKGGSVSGSGGSGGN